MLLVEFFTVDLTIIYLEWNEGPAFVPFHKRKRTVPTTGIAFKGRLIIYLAIPSLEKRFPTGARRDLPSLVIPPR